MCWLLLLVMVKLHHKLDLSLMKPEFFFLSQQRFYYLPQIRGHVLYNSPADTAICEFAPLLPEIIIIFIPSELCDVCSNVLVTVMVLISDIAVLLAVFQLLCR